MSDRYLVIGDVHLPAEHPDYLAFTAAVRDAYGLDTVLQVGDMVDFSAISYHEHDPDLPSSGDELRDVRSRLQEWAKEFPELVITMGNHDALPRRKMLSYGLPQAFLRGYNELFGTPATWAWKPRMHVFRLECGMPVVMQHAISPSLQAGAGKLRTASLIGGHHHYTQGVAWNAAPDWRLFYMAVGCGVDPAHPAMQYADQGVLKMPLLGCGVIVDGWATTLPMWLNKAGRWTGKVP